MIDRDSPTIPGMCCMRSDCADTYCPGRQMARDLEREIKLHTKDGGHRISGDDSSRIQPPAQQEPGWFRSFARALWAWLTMKEQP